MKILISGSSGLVGSALNSFLREKGHEVLKLVRVRADLKPDEIGWDPKQGGVISPSLIEGLDAVVHLAGENIMGRWTRAKKERIRESRVKGTKLLVRALIQLKKPPVVFICASAVGYYGNRGDEILTEQSAKGRGFLADVCQEWEEATKEVLEKGIRTVNMRIGMVLSEKGGALKQMLPIFRWGLGGKMGTGEQWMSWIALDDLVRVVEFLLQQKNVAGPVNAVAPQPIKNGVYTEALGKILHRPAFFGMPAIAVKLVFGELGEELLLASERVQPQKLEEAGFVFNYPILDNALKHILK